MTQIGSLFGQYRIVGLIGRGSNGSVFRATDERDGSDVALKLIDSDVALEERFRDRRELAAVSRLDHPGLVRVVESGVVDETPYIVMELVSGLTLEELINQSAPLPWRRCVEILKELATVLDYVHGEKILHRDIKPSNILMANGTRPKLLDFGLCRSVLDSCHTGEGAIIGSFRYVAPECLTGAAESTTGSDMWSMGVVFYRMLTARWHVSGDPRSVVEWVQAVHREPTPPPETINPQIPSAVSHLALQLLVRDPAGRMGRANLCAAACAALLSPVKIPGPPTERPRAVAPVSRPVDRFWRWIAAAAVSSALSGALVSAAVLSLFFPRADSGDTAKVPADYRFAQVQFCNAFDEGLRRLDAAQDEYAKANYTVSRVEWGASLAAIVTANKFLEQLVKGRTATVQEDPATHVREACWPMLGRSHTRLNADLIAHRQ